MKPAELLQPGKKLLHRSDASAASRLIFALARSVVQRVVKICSARLCLTHQSRQFQIAVCSEEALHRLPVNATEVFPIDEQIRSVRHFQFGCFQSIARSGKCMTDGKLAR